MRMILEANYYSQHFEKKVLPAMWLYTSSENAEIEIEMRLFHTQKKVTFF